MAITPATGYQVDPNNPNGVIKADSAAMPGSYGAIQQSSQAPSMALGAVNNTQQPSPLSITGQTQNNSNPYTNSSSDAYFQNLANTNPQGADAAMTKAGYGATQPDPSITQAYQIGTYDQRANLAQQYGITNYTGTADQNINLLQKYKSGLSQAKADGTTPPMTQGSASSMVQQYAPPSQTPSQNPLDTILGQDKGYQQLMQDYKDYTNSQSQKETLSSEYKGMLKDAGIEGIDTELVNDKKIIDGTDQDIRNEVSAAGGFATESQVQALASARNKTLIQNYNNLLQTRDNAVSHINTMIGLSEQDRQYAQQQLSNQLNFDKQILDYTQKFTQNAQDSLTNMQKTEGWDGIYKATLASGDPSAIARINATMGNGFDLTTMAQADAQTRKADALEASQKSAQAQATLANTKANTTNTQTNTKKTLAEISDASGTPNPAKVNLPGYDSSGVKYSISSAYSEVQKAIKDQGLTGTRNLLDPNTYNYFKAWWVQQGLTDASFDSEFGGRKDPGLVKSNVYQ